MTPWVGGRVLEWGCRHAADSAVLRMRIGAGLDLHGADIRDGSLFEPFHAFSGYRRAGRPIEAVNRLLERRPLSLVATSLALAAPRAS